MFPLGDHVNIPLHYFVKKNLDQAVIDQLLNKSVNRPIIYSGQHFGLKNIKQHFLSRPYYTG